MRAYSVPLRNAALGYLRLAGDDMPEPYAEAARGVAGAMREAPEMVAGPGSFDSLANALPGVVAKRGAMGVFCCASARDRAAAGRSRSRTARSRPWRSPRCSCSRRSPDRSASAFDPWRERPIRDGNGGPVGGWSSALVL